MKNLLILILFLILIWPARADLTITATPGFVFSDSASGRPTVANLNRALNMTYSISGSLGGTNAGLSAKSVSGTMLMDSVVDNVTVEFDGSSPRAIQVKDSGIDVDQIAVGIAGLGLGGGGGAALSNKVDGVTIFITNDVVTLGTNLPVGHLNVSSNYVVVGTTNNAAYAFSPLKFATNVFPQFTFTSSGVALTTISAAGKYLDTAHNLGVKPVDVHLVAVCTTADLNYSVGDEVQLVQPNGQEIMYFANTTNVGFVAASSAGFWRFPDKSSGTATAPTLGSWSVKVYARP